MKNTEKKKKKSDVVWAATVGFENNIQEVTTRLGAIWLCIVIM